MKKAQYTQPELEMRKLFSFDTVSTSGDDNDLDIGDTDWGDF